MLEYLLKGLFPSTTPSASPSLEVLPSPQRLIDEKVQRVSNPSFTVNKAEVSSVSWVDDLLLPPLEESIEHSLVHIPQDPNNILSTLPDEDLTLAINALGDGIYYLGLMQGVSYSTIRAYFSWVTSILNDALPFPVPEECQGIQNIFQRCKVLNEEKEELEKLEQLYGERYEDELVKVSLKRANTVLGLGVQETYSMYVGTSNFGGGSRMALLDFEKNENGTFDIILHNNCYNIFSEGVQKSVKMLKTPLVHYRNVPKDVLFFKESANLHYLDATFFQALIELVLFSTQHAEVCLNANSFNKVFNYLEPYRVEEWTYGLITETRNGSPLNVISEWIRKQFKKKYLYKEAAFFIKLKTFILSYQKLQKVLELDNHKGVLARYILTQAARKLYRRIYKHMNKDYLPKEYVNTELFNKAMATVSHVLNIIASHEKAILALRSGLELIYIPNDTWNMDIRTYFDATYSVPPLTTLLPLSAVLQKWLFKENTLQNRVEYVKGILSGEFENKNQIALFEIYAIVERLPIPTSNSEGEESCWISRCHTTKSFNKTLETLEQKQAVLNTLSLLLRLYTQTSNDYYVKRLAVVLPISALIHYLALSIDKELGYASKASLMHYNIPFDETLIYQEGLSFPFVVDFQKVQQALAYFMAFKAYAKDKDVLFDKEEKKAKLNKGEIIDLKGNTQYWLALSDYENVRKVLLTAPNDEFRSEEEAVLKKQYDAQKDIYNRWLKRKRKFERWKVSRRQGEEPKDPFGKGIITEKMIANPPPVPQRRVNLPLSAQHILLLEKDMSVSPSLLETAGCGHIHLLRGCYLVLNNLLTSGDKENLKKKIYVNIQRKSPYNYKVSIEKYFPRNHSETVQNTLKGTYRTGIETSWKFSKERRTDEWDISKAQGISLFANAKLKADLQSRIEQASSQWRIAPHIWLYEAMKEIKSFDDIKIQNEFFHLFLRCVIEPKTHRIHLGLGELILDDIALQDSLRHFISKGLFHFSRVNQNIEAAGFFFELCFYTYRYLCEGKRITASNRFNCSSEILKWLEKDNLTEKELCLLYFYKCLFISSVSILDDASVLYSSWMAYKFYEVAGKEKISKILLEYVERNVYVHIKNLKPGKIERFGKALFANLPFSIPYEPKGIWEIASQGLPYIQNGDLCIELSEGAFFIEGKRISRCFLEKEWYAKRNFIRVLGLMPSLVCTSEGEAVRCVHPEKGTFLIWHTGAGLVIQRYFDELGEMLEYAESWDKNVLAKDFLYWKSKDINKQYLTSPDDLKLAYVIENQVMRTVDQQYIVSHPDSEKCAFCQFDCWNNILLYTNEQGVAEIVFQRYTSQNHNALIFRNEEAYFLWNENAKFALVFDHPTHILGDFQNYLWLSSLDGLKTMILIPFQPMEEHRSHFAALKISNKKSLIDSRPDNQRRQKEAFIYFTYKLEDGILKPITLEGRFFLAYIYITQAGNKEALMLVKSKLEGERLSPTCLQIIKMILAEENFLHPDSFHVVLYILLIYMKEMDKVSHKPIKEYFTKEHFENPLSAYIIITYVVRAAFQTTHNITIQCRLAPEDEIYLYENLLEEGNEKAERGWSKKDFKNFSVDNLKAFLLTLKLRLNFLQKGSSDLRTFKYGESEDPIFKIMKGAPIKIPNKQLEETHPEVYKNQVESSLAWLKQGKSTKLCTTVPRSLEFDKNGAIFREFYKIAKEGSPLERQKAIFRLYLWKNLFSGSMLLDLYVVLLYQPHRFPDMVDVFSERSEEVLQFVESVNSAYVKTPQDQFKLDLYKQQPSTSGSGVTLCYPPSLQPSSGDKVVATTPEKFSMLQKGVGALSFPDNASRWELFENWKISFLEESENVLQNPDDIHFHFNEKLLSKSEQSYAEVIKDNYLELKEDYLVGKEKNLKRKPYQLKEGEAQNFLSVIREQKEIVQAKRQSLEIALLKAANASFKDEPAKIRAGLGGNAISAMTLADCKELLLSSSHGWSSYPTIANMTLELMDCKSYESQLSRLEKNVSKLASSTAQDSALCYEIAQELSSSYHFKDQSPDIKVAYYVFIGESDLLPYDFQVDIVATLLVMHQTDKGRFKDTIVQLIMGGGKTALIAVLVLYLTARHDKCISILIVLPALLKNLQINLGRWMFQIFGKKVIPLDYSRADLTDYNLMKILRCVKEGAKNRDCFIGTLPTFQNFELELFSTTKRLVECLNEIKTQKQNSFLNSAQWKHLDKLNEKKNKLKKTAELLSDNVELNAERMQPLLDEFDQLLHCLFQVNFPGGGEQQINTDQNLLLLFIYKQCVRKDLLIPTLENNPSLAETIRLEKDEQNLVSYETYHEHIVPILAQEIIDNYSLIHMYIEGYQDPCMRYLTGKMAPKLQKLIDSGLFLTKEYIGEDKDLKSHDYFTLQDDLEFLYHLKKCAEHPKSKPIIDLIAKAKHFLQDLLLTMFSKCAGKDYAPPKDRPRPGEIVRYNGVDNQARGSIGYNMEAACYFYQWGAARNLSKEAFLEFARFTEESARYYSHKNSEIYEETIEYKEFEKTFGIKLDEIEDIEKVKNTLNNLSKDIEHRLEVQFEFIQRYVVHYQERLSSTQADVPDLFFSMRGMSAITWPANVLSKSLAEGHRPDKGTSGRISHTTASKVPMERIFTSTFQTVEEMLDSVFLKFKEPHRLKGITDPGGLFKKFKGIFKVAQDTVKYLIKRKKTGHVDPAIKNVIFFQADPGEVHSGIPYVWRLGQSSPERIGDTTEESFQAMGLEPGNYFVIMGELQSIGTDIPNSFDAVYILTYMKGMLKDKYEQALLRLRKYFFQQDRVIVMTPETLETVINHAKTEQDFSDELSKTQSIHQAELSVRYFLQHIAHVARGPSGLEIRKAIRSFVHDELPEDQFCQAVNIYYPFLVTTTDEDAFRMHGRLTAEEDTKEVLKSFLEKVFKEFKENVPDIAVVEKARTEKERLIKSMRGLPKQWKFSNLHIGIEQEVAIQEELSIHQEVNVSIEEDELKVEYESYATAPQEDFVEESEFDIEIVLEWIRILSTGDISDESVISVAQQLSLTVETFRSAHKYHTIFPGNLYGTRNFFNVFKNTVFPVFSPIHRPATGILVVQKNENDFCFLLLSLIETDMVKIHLKQLYASVDLLVNNVWMIQPDGSPMFIHPRMPQLPTENPSFLKGIFDVNAFEGNVGHLERMYEDTEIWLLEQKDLKLRYLQLKTMQNDYQKDILRRNFLTSLDTSQASSPFQCHVFQKRKKMEAKQKGRFIPQSVEEVKLLPPKSVYQLNVNYVKHLGVKFDSQDPLDISVKQSLAAKKGLEAEADIKDEIERHVAEQFNALRPFHIPFLTNTQMSWLSLSMVKYIENIEQIFSIEGDEGEKIIVYHLSKEQVLSLEDHQVDLIPYTNPAFYPFFSQPWQIQAVPMEHLDKINPDFLHMLSKKQIRAFDASFDHIIKAIAPRQVPNIHGNLLRYIDPAHYGRITEQQIRQITDRTLIKDLEVLSNQNRAFVSEGVWTSWISPEMCRYIDTETQLKYLLKEEQIQILSEYIVPLLNPATQVPKISERQVPFLSGPAQIQACPIPLIHKLNEVQIPHINAGMVPFLREKQVGMITDPKLFDFLSDYEDPSSNSVNQFQWIEKTQFSLLEKEHIHALKNDTLLEFANWVIDTFCKECKKQALKEGKGPMPTWEAFAEELISKQIETFDSHELIELLLPWQIKTLRKDQVRFLQYPWQIKACSEENIPYLKEEQIPHIPVKKAVLVNEDEAAYLTVDQLIYIRKRDQALWEKIEPKVTRQQVSLFNTQKLFDQLSLPLLRWMSIEQVQFLKTTEQVNACPNDFLLRLDKHQVRLLGPDKIKLIDDKQVKYLTAEQLKHIHSDQYAHLKSKQVSLLDPDQLLLLERFAPKKRVEENLKYITQTQIEKFSWKHVDILRAEHINALPKTSDVWRLLCPFGQVKLVEPRNVNRIRKDHVKHITNPKAIRKLKDKRVKYLTASQLKMRTWEQWIPYMLSTVILGVIAFIPSMIARTAFVSEKIFNTCPIRGCKTIKKLDKYPRRLRFLYYQIFFGGT